MHQALLKALSTMMPCTVHDNPGMEHQQSSFAKKAEYREVMELDCSHSCHGIETKLENR